MCFFAKPISDLELCCLLNEDGEELVVYSVLNVEAATCCAILACNNWSEIYITQTSTRTNRSCTRFREHSMRRLGDFDV